MTTFKQEPIKFNYSKESQEKFILELLYKIRQKKCYNTIDQIDTLDSIDIQSLSDTLTDGKRSKTVFCLVNNILSNKKSHSELIKILDNYSLIGSGADGDVRYVEFHKKDSNLKANMVYKIKKNTDIYDLLSEYIIGIYLNDLISQIPTFTYTIGYRSPDNGVNELLMSSFIENASTFNEKCKSFNFKNYLSYIYQILISLELAKRHILFSHNDMHENNIMIKEKPVKYNVSFETKTYCVSDNFHPVIIDFSRSTVVIDNCFVGFGAYEMTYINRKNTKSIPYGGEAFVFMINIFIILNHYRAIFTDDIKKKFEKVMDIYGDYKNLYNKQKKARSVLSVQNLDSNQLRIPPIFVVDELLKVFPEESLGILTVKDRDRLYESPRTIDNIMFYKNLISKNMDTTERLTDISKCLIKTDSFLFNKYLQKKLEDRREFFSDNLELFKFLKDKYSEVISDITTKSDKKMLSEYKSIVNPLSIQNLVSRKPYKFFPDFDKVNSMNINKLLIVSKNIDKFEQFLWLYYIILETGLKEQEPYKSWVDYFLDNNTDLTYYAKNASYIRSLCLFIKVEMFIKGITY